MIIIDGITYEDKMLLYNMYKNKIVMVKMGKMKKKQVFFKKEFEKDIHSFLIHI